MSSKKTGSGWGSGGILNKNTSKTKPKQTSSWGVPLKQGKEEEVVESKAQT